MAYQTQQKTGKAKPVRLPGLSRVSQLVLVIGIFLILFIPTYLIYQQQPKTQQRLAATLATIQKALAQEITPKTKLEAELKATEEELARIRAQYPTTSQTPEITDRLFSLARENGATVTMCKASVSKRKLGEGKDAIEFPLLVFELGLKGQAPCFQKFLIAVDTEFLTSELKQVSFVIPEKEEAEHTATITIEMLCLPTGGQFPAEKGR